MHYLYVLESPKYSRLYVGISANVNLRLAQHNAGKVKSTKSYRPYLVIHVEDFQTKKEARVRELAIKKSGKLRKLLKTHGAIV